jgi:3-mercaptopyruvate sulfurtransferase SseA
MSYVVGIGVPETFGFTWRNDSRAAQPEKYEEITMDRTISTKDLKTKLDRKDAIKLVETLAPERFREAHLPGALNLPPDKIKELAPHLLPDKDAEIVTYCTNAH